MLSIVICIAFLKKHFFTCHFLQELHLCSVDPPRMSIDTLKPVHPRSEGLAPKDAFVIEKIWNQYKKKSSASHQAERLWLCDVSAPTYILWFICDDERPTCGTRTLWLVPLRHVQTAWLSWGLGDRAAIGGNALARRDITSASLLFVDSFFFQSAQFSLRPQKCFISLVVFRGVWVQCVKVWKTSLTELKLWW